MLREYFTNRWVIGGFLFLIVFGIACYFWYQHELAPYKQPEVESAELLRQSERAQKAEIGSETEQAADIPMESVTPSAKTGPLKLADITIEWPEGADWPVNWKELVALPPEEYHKLPAATRQAIVKAYYAEHGLERPPAGFHYRLNSKTGAWDLHPNNKPIITIHWKGNSYGQLHQLTDEEYERYKALERIATNPESVASHLERGGRPSQYLAYPLAACNLAQKWFDVLHEKTRGPAPSATSGAFYDREYTESDRERDHRLIREAIDAVTPPPRDGSVDETVLNQILDEIEAELGITIERETQAEKFSRRHFEQILNSLESWEDR